MKYPYFNQTKRIFALLLCFSIFQTFYSHAARSEGSAKLSYVNGMDLGIIIDACTAENDLFILSTLGIYRLDLASEGDLPKKIVDLSPFQRGPLTPLAPDSGYEKELWEQGVGLLFSLGNSVYGLHPYTGQITRLEGGGMKTITKIPEEQFYYTDQGEERIKEVITAFGAENRFFIVLRSFTYEEGEEIKLYVWDLVSQHMEAIDVESLESAVPGAPGQLLIAIKEESDPYPEWRTYDLKTHAIGEAFAGGEEAVYSPALQSQSNTLYYVSSAGTVIELLPDGHTTHKAILPAQYPELSDRSFIIGENQYVYVNSGVHIRDVSPGIQAKFSTLRIMGQIDDSLIQRYTAEHPDVFVNSADRVPGFLEFQESIVSRDNNIDIYILNTTQFYADALKKGYADPLDTNETLHNLSAQFYPSIREVLSYQGYLAAFPLSINPNVWTLNRSQWEALDMGSYPVTLDEMLLRTQMWQKEQADDYPQHTFLDTNMGLEQFLNSIVYQYLIEYETEGTPVSFDTPAFRSSIDSIMRYKDIFDIDVSGISFPLIMPYSPGGIGLFYYDADQVISILPPALNEGSSHLCGASMEVMILNPLSGKKDLAMDFITFCADNMDLQSQYTMYESLTEPVRHPNHEENLSVLRGRIEGLERAISKAEGVDRTELERQLSLEQERYTLNEKGIWLISQEWIDIKESISSRMVVPVHSIFMNSPFSERDEAITNVLNLFAGSGMSIDTLINHLDSIARLQFSENR